MPFASGLLAACGGFLIAVLWMDLIFDVQVLRHRRAGAELPETVLVSIATYYRRVTTTASPMGHLVGAVMALTLLTGVARLALGNVARGPALASLLLAGGPIALAIVRVVPNAVRLGARSDDAARQSQLARAICREHLLCLAGMLGFVALELASALR